MRSFGFAVIAALSFGVALYALIGYGLLPVGKLVHPDMRAAFESNRIIVYVHVFASSLALVCGPLAFIERIRRHHLSWHRWLGRVYLVLGVLVGGSFGLALAFRAFGGAVSTAGFAGLAVLWLSTGLMGYIAIRRGEIESHRRWMIRNFALTLAAVTLRFYVPLAMLLDFDFELAYRAIAWLCWVPNLVLAELLIGRRRAESSWKSI